MAFSNIWCHIFTIHMLFRFEIKRLHFNSKFRDDLKKLNMYMYVVYTTPKSAGKTFLTFEKLFTHKKVRILFRNL